MKFAVVTSWPERHWDKYAKRCLDTFFQHWPGFELLPYPDTPLYEQSAWMTDFKARHADLPTADYRMDAVRFAHKVAAIELACAATDADVLIWMDADCVTHAPVTEEWLAGLINSADFAYLRRGQKYPECGFMMFRMNERGRGFIAEVVNEYRTDALFQMAEWHDSWVINQVRGRLEDAGRLTSASLSGDAEGTPHPLINGPLGARLDHLKGPRKMAGRSHDRDLSTRRSEPYWKRKK